VFSNNFLLQVELLILSHHFYKSSACLDGVDVLVTLAANRVESYVLEGDFSCLARLITGVSNFHSLNFILNILIENGQLDLLLQKYSTADTGTATSEAVRGFRLSVLTSLKLFNPHDLDAFAMVRNITPLSSKLLPILDFRSNSNNPLLLYYLLYTIKIVLNEKFLHDTISFLTVNLLNVYLCLYMPIYGS